MKILQVNCVYGSGSTGKIVQDIHRELQKSGIESVVCYGRGKKVCKPDVYKTCGELYSKMNNALSRVTGVVYGGCRFSTDKLIRVIKREQPDIVHLHCLNGYFVNIYRLVTWLKENKIKTVLTLHAEFMYTANCGHALECNQWKTGCGSCPRWRKETKSWFVDNTALSYRKMQKAFEGFEDDLIVTSVSPWLMERAKQAPILADKNHCVVLNGVDTTVFMAHNTEELRAKHGLKGERVIFHATPFFSDEPDHFKGGYYILKLAEMFQGENVKFFVAGSYAHDLKVPKNVVLLGKVSDQRELARYYSMADVTVITSKRETFSMIVAESLCCGTPVVGFRAGGPEQIALEQYSGFVEYGDVAALGNKVRNTLENGFIPSEISLRAKETYSKETMTHSYKTLYSSWEKIDGINWK